MSKYEEVCDQLSQSESQMRQYRDDIARFGQIFYVGFWNYLEVPQKHIHVIPSTMSEWSEGTMAVSHAIQIDDQGFYGYKIILEVEEGQQIQPSQQIAFLVGFKKRSDGRFVIKIGGVGEHTITNETELRTVYDQMFQALINLFSTSLDVMLSGGSRRIGFV